jgi:dipeptidyl aminopeptidase/acylaminoacyl peptidase
VALTRDGSATWGFGLYRFGVEVAQAAAERYRLKDGGIQWAPDSERFLVRRDDLRGVRVYPLYSSTSRLPVDHSYFYAAPGDTAMLRYDYYVFDVMQRSGVKVQDAPHGLLGTRGEARWGLTSDELYVMHTARGNKVIKLSSIESGAGASRILAIDSMPTFVDEEMQSWAVLDGGREVLWTSERDGWRHLYRFDEQGRLKNRITEGPWAVAEIHHIDPEAGQIWFTAWGREPGVPYYAHLYRVNFDGTGLIHLTPEEGNHSIHFAPGGGYLLDTYSSIDTPPATVLRAADGRLVMELERGDVTELRTTGWTAAETFTVKARDGQTDLWGILHKPSMFDPASKYPIIANVYPGPQMGSVRDWVFKGADSSLGTRERFPAAALDYYSGDGMGRSLAELGFIVIQLDAMGTSKRSKAFQDFFYGRVRDNGLPDQIAGIRQLAARFEWIDTTRVGIWGHSGGGYSAAAAMLHHPDFFQVGVSQSGNHDFRIYGWYWGEKYQGPFRMTDTGDNYEDEANYKYAEDLEGKLLLMSGDMDCNNPPAETLRLVDALIEANKPFDMLLVPDAGHQLPPYAIKRSWDYFVEHLLGGEPPTSYRMIGP